MATCAKCKASVPDWMEFCTKCGSPIPKAAPPAPVKAPLPVPSKAATAPPPRTDPEATVALVRPAGEAKPSQPSKFEGLDVELPPPEAATVKLDLEEVEARRRASGATAEAVCKFCKGPLDLEGGFCEYCGAPLEEAAPPGFIKPKPQPAASAAPLAVPPLEGAQPKPGGAAPPAEAPVSRQGQVPPAATPPPASAQAPTSGRVTPSPPMAAPAMPAPSGSPAPAKPKLAVTPVAPASKAVSPQPSLEVTRRAVPAIERAPSAPKAAVGKPPAAPATVPPKASVSPQRGIAEPKTPAVSPLPGVPAEQTGKEAIPAKKKGALPLGAAALVGIGIVVIAAGAAAWYFLRPAPAPVKPPPPVATTTPPPANVAPPAPAPTAPASETPAPVEAAAEAPRPRATRVSKPAPPPAPTPAPAAPEVDPKKVQLANLQNLARDAYSKSNFAEPSGASAIGYMTQALAIDPNDDYSKKLLQNAVNGGTYQVQQAIAKKDFATAQRLAGEMAQLLPGRKEVEGLKEDIASAQRAEEAAHRPPPVTPQVSFHVMHMHTDKAPADKGPYCEGTLMVIGGHLKFAVQSSTDGQTHPFDVACSDVREVKKNSRVASHQGGFHVRTAQVNFNFVPADAGSSPAPALASACSK
jgi:hypothetical protein